METLMKEIDKILEAKNERIFILKWEKECAEKEVAELKKEIEKLKKENEVNRV